MGRCLSLVLGALIVACQNSRVASDQGITGTGAIILNHRSVFIPFLYFFVAHGPYLTDPHKVQNHPGVVEFDVTSRFERRC